MKRVALITESATRKEDCMPASEFYYSSKSRWVSSIIDYMKVRDFSSDDIYFLSYYQHRIIPFNQEICNYPIQNVPPNKKERDVMANKVLTFLKSLTDEIFVEIHTGRSFADNIMPLLQQEGIPFRFYADGIALGKKPQYYQDLITEEETRRKLKEIQKEKWRLISSIEYQSLHEARNIVEQYEHKAQLFGIEDCFNEMKDLLKKHSNRQKDANQALKEFEKHLSEEEDVEILLAFINQKRTLSALFQQPDLYESLKSKFGKALAKYTRYLIKIGYANQLENKISDALLRIQIMLMK